MQGEASLSDELPSGRLTLDIVISAITVCRSVEDMTIFDFTSSLAKTLRLTILDRTNPIVIGFQRIRYRVNPHRQVEAVKKLTGLYR